MSYARSLSCTLSDRLDRLHDQLTQLGARLRENIARAVSRTVADTVRLAVRATLDVVCGPAPIRIWRHSDPWAQGDPWRDEPVVDEQPTIKPDRRWRPALAAASQILARLWQPGRRILAIVAALSAGIAGWIASRPAAVVAAATVLMATSDLSRGMIAGLRRIHPFSGLRN